MPFEFELFGKLLSYDVINLVLTIVSGLACFMFLGIKNREAEYSKIEEITGVSGALGKLLSVVICLIIGALIGFVTCIY